MVHTVYFPLILLPILLTSTKFLLSCSHHRMCWYRWESWKKKKCPLILFRFDWITIKCCLMSMSLKCPWNEKLRYWKIGEFDRPFSLLKAFQIRLFFNTLIFHFIGTLNVVKCIKFNGVNHKETLFSLGGWQYCHVSCQCISLCQHSLMSPAVFCKAIVPEHLARVCVPSHFTVFICAPFAFLVA